MILFVISFLTRRIFVKMEKNEIYIYIYLYIYIMCKVHVLCGKKNTICAIFKCELPFREGKSGVNIYGTNPDNKMQILLQLRQER